MSHPQVDQLSAFALGKLEPSDVDALESHLAGCETCCATLQQIRDDTFIGLVRRSGSTPSEPAAGPQATTLAPERDRQSSVAPANGGAAPGLPPDLPAELVNHPRYRLIAALGQGGMGAVYEAEHRLMQRRVALKVINPEWVASRAAVERFRREAQAAARLHHPNIVTAYDAEQAGAVHFLVMEYVKGTDLARLVGEHGPLPVGQACDYIRQAALGLQHAMDNGMVHRDIKPHNLMVTSAGEVKILDFGLASLTSEATAAGAGASSITPLVQGSGLTQVGALMGTPDFMAPEQARDAHAADIRADVYSLGCALYCLLTGKVPFPGGTPLDKIIGHAERRAEPVEVLRNGLPGGLVQVIARMMAKEPAQRYQTPAEVAQALAPFAETCSPVAGQTAITAPSDRPRARRRRLVATLVAAAAGALLLGAIVYISTDNGRLVIDSKVDDVQVVVSKGGKEYEVIDLMSGTAVKRLPSGDYQIRLKDAGPIVKLDRGGFTMTRGGQVIVKVTADQTTKTTAAAQPFVILARDAQAEQKHATLEEAVRAAESGDTIEIRGNGPFACEPITVQENALVIRAAAGFAPVLRLSAANKDNDQPLFLVKAPLVLEGLELQRLDASPWREEQPTYLPLVRVSDTSFDAANCLFTMKRQKGPRGLQAIQAARSPSSTVRLRNCVFLEGDMFLCMNGVRATLSMENCLIKGMGYAVGSNFYSDLADVKIDIHRSTLAGGQSFVFVMMPGVELLKLPAGSCRIEWTDNVVLSMPLLVMGGVQKDEKPPNPLQLEKHFSHAVKVIGRRNLYSFRDPFSYFYFPPGDKAQARQMLADWEALWAQKETGSLQEQAKLKKYDAVFRKGGMAVDDFRLLPGTPGQAAGKDGNDLGADVDLLGPGAAYERWQKTPVYQQWRKQIQAQMSR